MPIIKATVFPHGITGGREITHGRTLTDDLPEDIIGQVVGDVVHRAWRNGYDPASPSFVAIVKFSK